MATAWLSVTEFLPNIGLDVLVYLHQPMHDLHSKPFSGIGVAHVLRFTEDMRPIWDDGGDTDPTYSITHWMLPPPAPTDKLDWPGRRLCGCCTREHAEWEYAAIVAERGQG